MDWKNVKTELQKPLSPDAIKPPPKGKFGEYVDALHVIREANRIFGEDGWSYTVTRLEQTHSEIVDVTYNGTTKKQLRTSFLCAVRVDVDGVIREGLAVGVGNGKPENAGDVIESAVKEAETDALKRALRTFGNTFGLALYEKDKNKREVGYDEPTDEEKAQARMVYAKKLAVIIREADGKDGAADVVHRYAKNILAMQEGDKDAYKIVEQAALDMGATIRTEDNK